SGLSHHRSITGPSKSCPHGAGDRCAVRGWADRVRPVPPPKWQSLHLAGCQGAGGAVLMAWLDVLSAPEHERPVSMPRTAPTGGTPSGRAGLRRECEEPAWSAPGGRDGRLNRAAFSVAQLVAGGEVDPTDAHRELTDAARRC